MRVPASCLIIVFIAAYFFSTCFNKQINGAQDLTSGNKYTNFNFPRDHFNHPGVLTEWWYFNGHLVTKEGKTLAYGVCLFRASPVYYFVHASLTDFSTGQFVFDRVFYPSSKVEVNKVIGIISYDKDCMIRVSGTTIAGLTAVWGANELELSFEQAKPPMIINGSGKIDMPEGGLSNYYSLTRMKTSGKLSMKGSSYKVSGISWMDHQWGNYYVKNKGWDWFSIQLDDSTDYNLYSFRDQRGRIIHQYVNVMEADSHVDMSRTFLVQKKGVWKNGITGRKFITDWQLIIPSRKDTLLLSAMNENQEIYSSLKRDFFPSYWEGACAVEKHTADGRIVFGKAFSEHFPLGK